MTKLLFLGTKGEIEEYTETHKFNSSLLVKAGESKILLDYGKLRKYSLEELAPDAILITHAHPDHYAWLYEDVKSAVPVYLTKETLEYGKFRPENPRVIEPGAGFVIGQFSCMPYRVLHSIRCPAVGYRVKTPDCTFIYNSDLVDIIEKENILAGVDYYIGDGSSIKANLVRRRDDILFGHTRTTTQINWCKKQGITNIIFTHLGKETIAREDEFNKEHPEALLAYDGLEMDIGTEVST
ncbi:MAG: MBL fold metallo-hydrolase [Chloroflexi bacterium]|nr:MBL fold metallo-hydrolase [Chloroflexota bacterium]